MTEVPEVRDSVAVQYAAAVAEHLGEGWAARDSRFRWVGSALLLGPEGEEVSVQLGDEATYSRAAERGRVMFTSLTPDGLSGYGSGRSPDITVSASKPPFAVAKELERRMLREYRRWLAQARENKRDHDEREAERAAVVDEAAAILSELGYVDVWDRRERHGKPSGGLSLGGYKSPVQVKLEVGIRPGRSYDYGYPTTAKATVEVHRHLVPALARALATLAAPERAGEVPEARPEKSEAEWLCDGCWEHATGAFCAVCQDGCTRDLTHPGACYPEETSLTACTRCGQVGRLTRFEEGEGVA